MFTIPVLARALKGDREAIAVNGLMHYSFSDIDYLRNSKRKR